jgi:uncharacterized surface protein with fasciclin (FAS1) repeats
MSRFTLLLVALVAFASISTVRGVSLADAIAQNSDLSSLNELLHTSNFSEALAALNSSTPYTVFAPTNDALSNFNSDQSNSARNLVDVVLYHVASGTNDVSGLASNATNKFFFLPSLSNAQSGDPQLIQFERNPDDPNTAPTIVFGGPGEDARRATLGGAPTQADNGLLYTVDKVLLPPDSPSSTLQRTGLTGLYDALNSSDNLNTIDSANKVTVFAPNNDAFNNAGSTLAGLSSSDLNQVLLYHVVMDQVLTSDKLENNTFTTAQGSDITVTRDSSGNIFVNGAQVQDDVLLNNGVLHILDQVLIPAGVTPQAAAGKKTLGPAPLWRTSD